MILIHEEYIKAANDVERIIKIEDMSIFRLELEKSADGVMNKSYFYNHMNVLFLNICLNRCDELGPAAVDRAFKAREIIVEIIVELNKETNNTQIQQITKKIMEEELKLKKVRAYKMSASNDERCSSVRGYYKNFNAASIDSKKAGWYDSDGKVELVDLYEDEEGKLYSTESLGKFKDVEKQYHEETLEKIKSKLTPEEISFLKI